MCDDFAETSRNFAERKKASPKRLHTIWFYPHNFREMIKLWKWRTDERLLGSGMRGVA